ncbi:MAG: Rrf2 family transcriptional regulator [Candidatus Omnitrophota bacterium]
MKLITRDTDYAVRALCCIAKQKEKIVSVSELVKALKIPRPFLRKILQILSKKDLIRSYKGKGGGFALLVGPEKISLAGIVAIFQGPVMFNDHTFKKKKCPNVKCCNIKEKIDCIEKYVISELNAINIASFIK